MATFNQNGVQFTATQGQSLPNKYGNGNNGDFADAETDGVEKFVNAVEIDWNTAKLGDAVTALSANVQEGVAVSNITETGDLLKVVAQLQAQVNVLTNLVKGLYATLAS